MKSFQPMNAEEHLQALIVQGHDWAIAALEAVEAQTRSRDAGDLATDLAALLGFETTPDDLWEIHQRVEALMCERDELRNA